MRETQSPKNLLKKFCSALLKGHFFCNAMQYYNAIRGMPLRSATQHNAMQCNATTGFATNVTFAPKV